MSTITSATMLVGDTGSGKSSLLATLAEWGWKKYKKVSLLYSSDGGGFPTKMEALIRAGIVRAWKLRTRGEAFETCSRACQGYWPTEFLNPLAGETKPGVRLIPNLRTSYKLFCAKCKVVVSTNYNRKAFSTAYLCPACKNKVDLQTGTVVSETEPSPFFKDVGFLFYDGLTTMNDWIMLDMADMTGKGVLGGETPAIGGRILSGDMVFGGSNRSHYGFAQTRSFHWVQDANNIQGLVVGPIFTARKQRATDTNSNIRVYGPQIAGQAKTADVPAWVGNCLGTSILIDEKGRKEWRLYLTEYTEPGDSVLHLCKTRAAPGTMPDFLSDGPIDPETNALVNGGEHFTQFNLGHFMDLLDAATTKTFDETMKLYPDAPGLSYLGTLNEEATRQADTESTRKAEQPTLSKISGAPNGVATKAKPMVLPAKPMLRRPPPRPGTK